MSEPATHPTTVLLVEDDRVQARLVQALFAQGDGRPTEVVVADCLAAGLSQLDARPIDVVLLDLNLPDSEGLETFSQLHRRAPDVPVVVQTGMDDVTLGTQAVELGAQDYLIKAQITGPILLRAVRYAIERAKVRAELARERDLLARSNAELERFASIASHDLQEPLRKIEAFGGRLVDTCGDAVSDRGRDYLQRMMNAAGRMRRLITDLLALSRVTSRGDSFVPVDLAAIVRDVLSDLEVRIEDTGACVEVGPLPTVDADPTQMRQLLQNLVGNALKFQHKDRPPHVEIQTRVGDGVRSEQAICTLTVKDDGIGFDPQHAERIFGAFERLHGRDTYEGTGIGLAVCAKIVERHGGRIRAESKPGQGATFEVRLPMRHDAPSEQRA